MEYSFKLQKSMQTLRETHKILSKNGNRKLISSMAMLTLLIQSLLYLVNFLSIKSMIKVLMLELLFVSNPSSPMFANSLINLKRDAGFLLGFELVFLLLSAAANLFLTASTILVAAVMHGGLDLTFKEVLHKALKSWKRPFFTWLCIVPFVVGYMVLVLAILVTLRLVIPDPAASLAASFAVGALASVFYVYILVFVALALVLSVLEETSGIQALKKATKIVKGMKLRGFLLNLVYLLLSSVLVQGIRLIHATKSEIFMIIIGLLVVNSMALVSMIWWIANTVLYYKCKENRGEKVELQGKTAEYTKIPFIAPQIGEDVL